MDHKKIIRAMKKRYCPEWVDWFLTSKEISGYEWLSYWDESPENEKDEVVFDIQTLIDRKIKYNSMK